jgi:hypothetical protein
MAIIKTVRYNLTSVSNVVFKQNMEFEFNQTNERPNCFQIRNYSTQVLYVGFNSSLTTDNFEVKIEGGATRVLTILDKQVTEIYFLINDNAKVVLNASYSDEIFNDDLDQSQAISFISVGSVKVTNGTDELMINTDGSIDVNVDDSTPIDVNVTGNVGIDDSTPIDVNVTGNVSIDDSTPIDINVTNTISVADFSSMLTKLDTIIALLDDIKTNTTP